MKCGYVVVYSSVWQPANRPRTVGQNQSGYWKGTASFPEEESILLPPVGVHVDGRVYYCY